MEPHNHPDYEQTFSRMATILERFMEALEQQHRRGLETDTRLDKLASSLREFAEDAKLRDAETTDKLNGLIDLMDRHLREHGKN